MTSSGRGIVLGCTTCGLDVVLDEVDEHAVRAALAAFFSAHEGCRTFVDLSRAGVPLPGRPDG